MVIIIVNVTESFVAGATRCLKWLSAEDKVEKADPQLMHSLQYDAQWRTTEIELEGSTAVTQRTYLLSVE